MLLTDGNPKYHQAHHKGVGSGIKLVTPSTHTNGHLDVLLSKETDSTFISPDGG